MRSAANVIRTLRRTGMKETLEEAAQTARRIYHGGNKPNAFAP